MWIVAFYCVRSLRYYKNMYSIYSTYIYIYIRMRIASLYSKLRVAYILCEFRIIMRSDSARYSCIYVKLSTFARINQIIANTCCLTGYFKTEKQQEIKVFAAFDFQQYAKLCYIPESIFCITNSKLPEACLLSVLEFIRFQPLWKKML